MIKVIYIATGGALGSVLRYWVSGLTHKLFNGGFPWGTLTVNLIGSLIIGILWGGSEIFIISHNIRIFLFLGLLGSFTTFSTFTLENFSLMRDGEYWSTALNVFLNVAFGIVLVFMGYFLVRLCIGIFK
ncbi:MAG: fluoride efflux transporter CrcB [Candidatus Omnitrophota bacterium]